MLVILIAWSMAGLLITSAYEPIQPAAPRPASWFALLVSNLTIVLIPLTIVVVLQAVGNWVRRPAVAVVITATLFALAHGGAGVERPALFVDRFASKGSIPTSLESSAADSLYRFAHLPPFDAACHQPRGETEHLVEHPVEVGTVSEPCGVRSVGQCVTAADPFDRAAHPKPT